MLHSLPWSMSSTFYLSNSPEIHLRLPPDPCKEDWNFQTRPLLMSPCENFLWHTVDSTVKNLPANSGDTGDVGSIPGLGRSPGGGNDNPLQYSCLENSMDRGAWWATVHGVAKSWTQLSSHARTGSLNPRLYYYSLECPY